MKEWVCAAHGEFEATEQKCPFGCSKSFVRREIRTAPSIRHRGTSNRDALTQQLASDYGLTNLANEGGQLSVMQALRKKNWADYKKGGVAPSAWADVPHSEDGWSTREEAAKKFRPEDIGMKSGAALQTTARGSEVTMYKGKQPVRTAIPKPRPMIVKDSKGNPLSYKAPLPEVAE